jgi:predicted RecA/RadA family phage recombinase
LSVAVATAKTGDAGQLMVVGAGNAAMTGAVISWTLMVCEVVELLPHSSVAVHVRVRLYEPVQAPGVVTSLCVREKTLPQLSVAVATANTGEAGQLMVEGAGNAAKTGAVISWTLMVWEALELLPHASVAVHVRVMLYEPVQAPGVDTSLCVREKTLPQLSVAVATSNAGEAGQFMVDGLGKAAITGGVISWTFMVCEAVELLPHSSVAVHVRVTLYEPVQVPGLVKSL